MPAADAAAIHARGDGRLHADSRRIHVAWRQQRVFRSSPDNPYHAYIEETYHTDVVTASTHINVGVDDEETLMRALRVVRMEASVFLALTAGSPFLDNAPTMSRSISARPDPRAAAHSYSAIKNDCSDGQPR